MNRRIGRLVVAALILGAVVLATAAPCSGEAAFPYRFYRSKPLFGALEGGPIWFRLTTPAVTDTNDVHSAFTTSAVTAITQAFTANESAALTSGTAYVGTLPVSMCRGVSISISAPLVADAAIAGGTATLYGENMLGDQITEPYTLNDNTKETIVSIRMFAVIDSLNIPKMDGTGVFVSVGRTLKVGLPMNLPMPTLLLAFQDGAQTADSVVGIDPDEIEKNTVYVSSTAWNGVVDFDFLFWIPPLGDVGGTTKWQ